LDIDLSVDFVGLKLRNPVVAASAGATETVERMTRLAEAGLGAIVMKSLFEDEVCRQAPRPHFAVIRRPDSIVFYSYEQASGWGPERYAEEVSRANNELEIPVIPSVNCKTEQGWRDYTRRMEDAGAPAIELNVSCPHGSLSFHLGDKAFQAILRAVEAARSSVSIPLIAKLPGQLTNPSAVVKAVEQTGVQGVTCFNRFTGLEIDTDTEQPIMHGAYAGHGGFYSIHYNMRWISQFSPLVNLHIAATGGVANSNDVVKYILTGARVVQTCTLIYLKGAQEAGKLVTGLGAWMRRKEYASLDDFRGNVSGEIIREGAQVDRTQQGVCVINDELCKNCGLCETVCIYGAPKAADGKERYVIGEECVGCGLCAEICPTGAISFKR